MHLQDNSITHRPVPLDTHSQWALNKPGSDGRLYPSKTMTSPYQTDQSHNMQQAQ